MIPRLAPRRSNRQSLSLDVTGVENASPFHSSAASSKPQNQTTCQAMDISSTRSSAEDDSSSTDNRQLPMTRAPLERRQVAVLPVQRREVLSNNSAALNPPPSPSPSLSQVQTAQTLEPFKSPLQSSISSDSFDWSSSDFSLTPPSTGPLLLVVSAKRLGQDVRRKHSKRRRRRRKAANDGSSSSNDDTNNGASCLWKDANALPSQDESSSEEEEEGLPFLFSQQDQVPPQKQAQQYWEYCYGKTTPTSSTTTTPIIDLPAAPGWSAKRKPPSKGCLSHKKLRKFKTPPTSPEDEEEIMADGTRPASSNKKGNRVQFGSPQAAEYEIDGPTAQLTPLPSEVTRKRYSMDQKKVVPEEEEMTVETKRNSSILAEWEDEPLQPVSSAQRRRQQRKNRRSSSIFTPSPTTSLLNSDDDDGGETDRDDEDRRNNIAPSPSTIVMENLASLCVDSPAAASAPPTLTPLSTGSDDSSSSENSTSRQQESKSMQTSHTAEFAISLQSVNCSGGAMETTPPRLDIIPVVNQVQASSSTAVSQSSTASTSTHTTETTPPPSNMSLDAIHSVGGALDHASPAASTMMLSKASGSTGSGHSPISRMSAGGNNKMGAAISTSAPMDIVEMLLKDPSSDQAWEAKDVFQSLAESTEPTKQRTDTTSGMLRSIVPRLDGVIACFDDLKEQARFSASTKSNTKFMLPSSKAPLARKLAVREWTDMEIEFLLELSVTLERNNERAMKLLHDADTLLNSKATPQAISTPKTTRKKLENEIYMLEKHIDRHKEFKRIHEALDAPYAALQCQATSHIGVCGFRLDEFTGTCLQLSYEHPIAGVESQFCFDLVQGTWKASYISDAFISSPNLLPATHPAAKFHEKLAKCCFEEHDDLLRRLKDLELQEAIMLLSRWLGLLDVAMNDLADIAAECPIAVEWPVVSVSVPSTKSETCLLSLTYDRKAIETLRPTRASLSCSGKDEEDLALPTGPGFIKQLVAQMAL